MDPSICSYCSGVDIRFSPAHRGSLFLWPYSMSLFLATLTMMLRWVFNVRTNEKVHEEDEEGAEVDDTGPLHSPVVVTVCVEGVHILCNHYEELHLQNVNQ